MNDNSRIYIGTAFIAGALLTLGFKDLLYPELEQRLREYRARRHAQSTSDLDDLPADVLVARPGPPRIVEGIEGCIGNTPLFRIKSLSEATGCEILGKAEVYFPIIMSFLFPLYQYKGFANSGGSS
jgi:cysteine synthase A